MSQEEKIFFFWENQKFSHFFNIFDQYILDILAILFLVQKKTLNFRNF